MELPEFSPKTKGKKKIIWEGLEMGLDENEAHQAGRDFGPQ